MFPARLGPSKFIGGTAAPGATRAHGAFVCVRLKSQARRIRAELEAISDGF
jgi:hypothetical protein